MEEYLSCPGTGNVTFRTYAHASIDRVMVTEIHIVMDLQSLGIDVQRQDLSGVESDEFNWQQEVEVNSQTL